MNDHTPPNPNAVVDKGADAMHRGVDAAKDYTQQGVDAASGVVEKTKQNVVDGAHKVDHALHDHPYYAIAIGAGAGVLVGMLLKRCCSR